MSLFNLNEIDIKESILKDSDNQNLGLEDKYINNIYRFPIDIGAYDKGHYMIINIGKQLKSRYTSEDAGEMQVEKNLNALQQELGGSISTIPGATRAIEEISSVGVEFGYELNLAFQNEANSTIPLALRSDKTGYRTKFREITSQLQKPSFLRTVRKTTDTIALYMPDTLQFNYNQGYSDIQMNQGFLPVLSAAGNEGVSLIKNIAGGANIMSAIKGSLKNMTPFIGTKIAENLLPNGQGTAISASLFGAVMNPQLELLYTSPEFRTFRFEFMMYPRSKKEAQEVQNIIKRLKFHQAPELLPGGPAGLFLVPPSEFDITFYYNGLENMNIPKISTCVLTNIETDYAPNGHFTAYEVPNELNSVSNGGTGMPVGIRLALTFKETQILTKFNYSGRNDVEDTRRERTY
jgi:hypothetical protein